MAKFIVYCFLLLSILVSAGCEPQKRMSKAERSAKVKKSLNKKRDQKREEAREKFQKKHYERQAPSTQQRMDYNKKMAEQRRKNNFSSTKPPVWVQIKVWFERMYRKIIPREKGLFGDDDIIK